MEAIAGTVIRDSLKSFLKLGYVTWIQGEVSHSDTLTTPSLEGTIYSNQLDFLKMAFGQGGEWDKEQAKQETHELLRRLNDMELLQNREKTFNNSKDNTTIKCGV